MDFQPSLSYSESLQKRFTEFWTISSDGKFTSVLTEVGTSNTYNITYDSTIFTESYDSDNNVYLFRDNSAQYAYPSMIKLHGTWLKRIDGTLAFNLVPAKNASGGVGMYDTVSGTFFENAGTGEFIAGDPVSE